MQTSSAIPSCGHGPLYGKNGILMCQWIHSQDIFKKYIKKDPLAKDPET